MPREVPRTDHELDMVGKTCPYPSIEARKKLKAMDSGEVLSCTVNRRGKEKRNLVQLAKESDNELAAIERDEDTYTIWIRKS